jgi:prepilin-type N-terminal cleavage/methylation domain-containing protein
MSRSFQAGFTLVEVVLALLMLAVGILALVGSSAMVTRMIGQGRRATLVSQVGAARIEWLRQLAGSTTPACAHPRLTAGSAVTTGIREAWTVAGSGNAREVMLALEYNSPHGPAGDTSRAVLLCRSLP